MPGAQRQRRVMRPAVVDRWGAFNGWGVNHQKSWFDWYLIWIQLTTTTNLPTVYIYIFILSNVSCVEKKSVVFPTAATLFYLYESFWSVLRSQAPETPQLGFRELNEPGLAWLLQPSPEPVELDVALHQGFLEPSPVEPDLALRQSLPDLLRNLLRIPVEPDRLCAKASPEPSPEPSSEPPPRTFSRTLLNLTWLCTKASGTFSATFSGTFSGTLLNLT